MLLVISYRCELDPTTSARVRRCSSLVHSLVPWAGNDVFRQGMLFIKSANALLRVYSNLVGCSAEVSGGDSPVPGCVELE